MNRFPMKFEIEANSRSGIEAIWTSQTNHLPPIPIAIPPQFSGPGGGYSPEDLFAMAVLNCIIATFKVYCEKSKMAFGQVKGRISLTVDKQPGTVTLAMTHLDVFLEVTGASDSEKVRQLLDSAIKDCAVSNSVKSGKTFHIDVRG